MKTGINKKAKLHNVKLHVRKDDNVVVISGNDKGKAGKILKVYPQKCRVIVEGVNIRKRHMKPTQSHPQGSIIEREFPIHASNVKKS
ncbi:50S ribosomal protein L24 [Chlorobium sp.]|jgi:large subunit ribosomal protein L24|uniref:50S ribosomal protein L24 n=1 Tax=Chlorobium sp. TaxID=1095 RepID=UPI003C6FE344